MSILEFFLEESLFDMRLFQSNKVLNFMVSFWQGTGAGKPCGTGLVVKLPNFNPGIFP